VRKLYGHNVAEREVVTLIFALRRKRKGSAGPTPYNRIAAELNAKGIKTRDGKLWRAAQVRRVLGRGEPLFNQKRYPKKQQLASRDYLNLGEISQLFNACKDVHERLIFEFLLGAGLRRTELCQVRLKDINTRKRLIDIIRGKGNVQGAVSISRRLSLMLYLYIQKRRRNGARWTDILLLNRRFTPLKPYDVYYLVRTVGVRAGIELHPHALRHTHGQILYNYVSDAIFTQVQLRHRRSDTTGIYANPLEEKRLRVLESLDRLIHGRSTLDLLHVSARKHRKTA
jgi:integrase